MNNNQSDKSEQVPSLEDDGFSFAPNGVDNLPDTAITVTTYQQYKNIVDKWIQGDLEGSLIIVGTAGVGKSETALRGFEALGLGRGDGSGAGDFAYIKGKATQRAVYEQIYRYKDRPIVIDDTDELLADTTVSALLKMLLETSDPKIVQWNTAKTLSDNSNLPPQVETTSRTLIIANELKLVSKNFGAVLDRSTILYFAPKAEEVHNYVKTWWDMKKHKDVFDFMADRIQLTPSPSCRFYVKGKLWKNAGLNWQNMVEAAIKPSDVRAAKMIELINKHTDPKTGEYVRGGVKQLIEEYKLAFGVSEQSAYSVKRAVEKTLGRISQHGKIVKEKMKTFHQKKKSEPKKSTKKKKK